MRRLVFLIAMLLVLFSVPVMAQEDAPRDKIDVVGYYYVEPDNVAQHSQNAGITLTIEVGEDERLRYKEGLQVVFKTKVLNGNNGNITIQINMLGVKKLLAHDGQEFGVGELGMGVMLTATYDGTHFISDIGRPRQFRYVEPAKISLTGNAYTITDASLPPVTGATTLLAFKAEATHTGNVTLSVNGSMAYPVFLSNGDQIPPGTLLNGEFILCSLTTIGGVGFRALNLRPQGNSKGLHIATATIPAGTYDVRDYVENWVLEPNIPAGITVGDYVFNGVVQATNSRITVPRVPVSNTQRGWYMELVEDGTVAAVAMVSFGYGGYSYYGSYLIGEATDAIVTLAYTITASPHLIESLHLGNPNYTIAAGDNVEAKLYIAN